MPRHRAGVLTLLLALGVLPGCIAPGPRPARDALTAAEHLQLGASYEHGGEPDLALREYERAAVGPQRATALACQGNLLAERHDLAAAEAKYREALAADPDNLYALNNLAWLLAGRPAALAEAEQLIRHALELKPEPRAAYEDTLQTILARRAQDGGEG